MGLFLILYGVLREHLDESGSVSLPSQVVETAGRAREQERGQDASGCDEDTGTADGSRSLPERRLTKDRWVNVMKETQGRIYSILPDGRALIATVLPDDTDDEVRVLWPDKDEITPDQRRKIFAIVGEIACWSGYAPEDARKALTADFLRENIQRLQMSAISLAMGGGCDKGTASLYIDFLINFCLENGIQTKQPLQEFAEDLERYTYAAMLNRKCLVCGQKAEIHHVDAIGMGYNRRRNRRLGTW